MSQTRVGEPRAHPFDDVDLTGVPSAWHSRFLNVRRSLESDPRVAVLDAALLDMAAQHLAEVVDSEATRLAAEALRRETRKILRRAVREGLDPSLPDD